MIEIKMPITAPSRTLLTLPVGHTTPWGDTKSFCLPVSPQFTLGEHLAWSFVA